MRGLFITFEGGEGAGKSTQIKRLAAVLLEHHGCEVVVTRQPGGTQYGQDIRQLILTPHPQENLSSKAELFLYLADRAHHVDTVIQPALAAGKTVLCDRYVDSTLAYQGYGRQLNLTELNTLNELATSGLTPDLTFLLDIDPELGLQRVLQRGKGNDRLEQEALTFHQRVRDGYLTLASASPQRWVRLDSRLSQDAIFEQVHLQTLQRLGL